MAQSAPPRTLHELADGVYVWLQPGGESGVSNAGVIVDDDGVTIVDTMMVRSQWEPFAEAVKALDVPMRRIVLTHGHIDHVGGTKAFPHAGVFASPQTSAVLDQHMPIDAYKTFMSAFEEEFDDLADTIVPGHGPVGGEREVRELQAYLRACVDAKGDPNAIPPGPWDSWLERERDAINVERAALLAEGRDEMPPSMLKAIGFG